MNVVREIERINALELQHNLKYEASWHYKYNKSAYIFVAGLDSGLTEGDLITVFSQYGEIVDCNLVRDKKTGASRGFCFIAYEDTRSCVVAVDNLCGAKLLNRVMRVDHVLNYRRPKKEEKKADDDKEKDGIELPSEDEDYDERRRQIWDYRLYEPSWVEVEAEGEDDVPDVVTNDESPTSSSTGTSTTAPAELSAEELARAHIAAVRAKRRARLGEAIQEEKQADEIEQARLKKREEARLAARKTDVERMLDAISSEPSSSSSSSTSKKPGKIDWKAVQAAAEQKQKAKSASSTRAPSHSRSRSRSRSPSHSHSRRSRSRSRSRDRHASSSSSSSRHRVDRSRSRSRDRRRSRSRDRSRERDRRRHSRERDSHDRDRRDGRRSRSRSRDRSRERR